MLDRRGKEKKCTFQVVLSVQVGIKMKRQIAQSFPIVAIDETQLNNVTFIRQREKFIFFSYSRHTRV